MRLHVTKIVTVLFDEVGPYACLNILRLLILSNSQRHCFLSLVPVFSFSSDFV